jgi:hypothetical protein
MNETSLQNVGLARVHTTAKQYAYLHKVSEEKQLLKVYYGMNTTVLKSGPPNRSNPATNMICGAACQSMMASAQPYTVARTGTSI